VASRTAEHLGRARLHGEAQHGHGWQLPTQHGRLQRYPNAVEYNLGARVDYAQVVEEFAQVGARKAAATLRPD
jgi:hypothetical protein